MNVDYVRKLGVRVLKSGLMILPRSDLKIEQLMDINFDRVSPNVREWWPKMTHAQHYKLIELLLPKQRNGVYFVGKGQSLDYLLPEVFDEHSDWPIFCINESTQIVEPFINELDNPIIFVHKDLNVVINKMSPDIICLGSPKVMARVADYPKIFYVPDVDFTKSVTCLAVSVAKQFDYKSGTFVCFDFLANRNRRYATTITRAPQSSVADLVQATNQLSLAIKGWSHRFITPSGQMSRL